MPKPTIVDFSTLFTANIIQPLCDLAWDVFGSDSEDRPVNTVDEAREKLKAVAQAGDTMTGPLVLPASDPTLNNHAARKSYVDDNVQAAKQYADNQLSTALDALYPIGSVYFCTVATDPNGVLPGTWTLLTAGRFLVSAGGTGDYALGATGGAATVVLTEAQMPAHVHAPVDGDSFVTNKTPASWQQTVGAGNLQLVNNNATASAGGNQPHENRPPYLAVNMWYRTA